MQKVTRAHTHTDLSCGPDGPGQVEFLPDGFAVVVVAIVVGALEAVTPQGLRGVLRAATGGRQTGFLTADGRG